MGRSNVGKSSLINALSYAAIVRVSEKPGLTRTINWYSLRDRLMLVDLPGYGFAFAAQEKVESWVNLTKIYLSSRKSLKRAMLLIDARHNLKQYDLDFMSYLDSVKTKYQIVLTKTDLVWPEDLARIASLIKQELKQRRYGIEHILMVSSRTKVGISLLQAELLGLVAKDKLPKRDTKQTLRANTVAQRNNYWRDSKDVL